MQRKNNGSIFTLINDSIRDTRFVYGKTDDKLLFTICK